MCVEDKLGTRKNISSLSIGSPGEKNNSDRDSSKGSSLLLECFVSWQLGSREQRAVDHGEMGNSWKP